MGCRGAPKHTITKHTITKHTITEPEPYLELLVAVRRDGWALDDGEQEIGVRCVAVPVPTARSPSPCRSRVGAPVTPVLLERAVPLLQAVVLGLARDLGPRPGPALLPSLRATIPAPAVPPEERDDP